MTKKIVIYVNYYFTILYIITTIPSNTLYHMNNLKSCFLIYLSKNSIHISPDINATTTPTIKVLKLLVIKAILLSLAYL